MPYDPAPETRQSRIHRGHRIVAVKLGDAWVGTIYAPGNNAIVDSIEGASPQEVLVRGVGLVNDLVGRRRSRLNGRPLGFNP